MSSALFGILQLDRGEPLGFANVAGLIQAWLQDAGGFAMVGLVVYLLYALATPTDKSQSEKHPRAGVAVHGADGGPGADLLRRAFGCWSARIVGTAARSWSSRSRTRAATTAGCRLIAPPPMFHAELVPMLLMVAGMFALLGIGEPFARDMVKIARRNLSLGFSGIRRFGRSVGAYARRRAHARRRSRSSPASSLYAVLGVALYAIGASDCSASGAGGCSSRSACSSARCSCSCCSRPRGRCGPSPSSASRKRPQPACSGCSCSSSFPFLFRNVWMATTKPVDEVRTLVDVDQPLDGAPGRCSRRRCSRRSTASPTTSRT